MKAQFNFSIVDSKKDCVEEFLANFEERKELHIIIDSNKFVFVLTELEYKNFLRIFTGKVEPKELYSLLKKYDKAKGFSMYKTVVRLILNNEVTEIETKINF